MESKILYYKAANGGLRFWKIWQDNGFLLMEYGVIGGTSIEESEPIPHGLGGRTQQEQLDSRMKSRINKKLDKGYVYSLEKARTGNPRNQLGFKKAAKCIAFNGKDGNVFYKGMTGIQMKLNGHHASVVNVDGKLTMYSNGGKVIDTMAHILDGLSVPVGRTIEGELYRHGLPLQTISSHVRRLQPDSKLIKFHIYDIDEQINYLDRYTILNLLFSKDKNVEVLQTTFVAGHFNLEPILKGAIDEKYEGLIFRLEGFGHEDGKRGKGLIKVKPRHFENFRVDDEFLVINIVPSKDGFARLVCQTENGKEFKVLVHGTHNYKALVLKEKEKYIGRHIRAEFECYTKAKIPNQPVAIEWREKHEEL